MARAAIPIRKSVTQAIEPLRHSSKMSADAAEYLRVFRHVGFLMRPPEHRTALEAISGQIALRLAVFFSRQVRLAGRPDRSDAMQTAKSGDRVRVQFARIGKSTAPDAKRRPPKVLEFVAGGSEVMPGLSQGVVGMAQGEKKRFKLQPDEAYGPVKPGLIKSIPRHQFPKRLTLRVGKRLSALSSSSGRRRRVRIVEINSKSVLVDGNHSLAGKVIELDVTLICVVSAAGNSVAAGSQEP